jgi:hypothetical protein
VHEIGFDADAVDLVFAGLVGGHADVGKNEISHGLLNGPMFGYQQSNFKKVVQSSILLEPNIFVPIIKKPLGPFQ